MRFAKLLIITSTLLSQTHAAPILTRVGQNLYAPVDQVELFARQAGGQDKRPRSGSTDDDPPSKRPRLPSDPDNVPPSLPSSSQTNQWGQFMASQVSSAPLSSAPPLSANPALTLAHLWNFHPDSIVMPAEKLTPLPLVMQSSPPPNRENPLPGASTPRPSPLSFATPESNVKDRGSPTNPVPRRSTHGGESQLPTSASSSAHNPPQRTLSVPDSWRSHELTNALKQKTPPAQQQLPTQSPSRVSSPVIGQQLHNSPTQSPPRVTSPVIGQQLHNSPTQSPSRVSSPGQEPRNSPTPRIPISQASVYQVAAVINPNPINPNPGIDPRLLMKSRSSSSPGALPSQSGSQTPERKSPSPSTQPRPSQGQPKPGK